MAHSGLGSGRRLCVLFQFEQSLFSVEAARIAGEGASRAKNAMAGDDERDGVMADGVSNCLGRHSGNPLLPGEGGGDFPIGHGHSKGDVEHDVPDGLPEGGRSQTQAGSEARIPAAEIHVEPFHGLAEDRDESLLMACVKRVRKMPLAVEPQPDKGLAVGRQRDAAKR